MAAARMKRSPLIRRQRLRSTRSLRALSTRFPARQPENDDLVESRRRDAYKRPQRGSCQVCGARGWVRRHHVFYEQHVRIEGGDPYDTANALWVGLERGAAYTCDCHRRHHDAIERIPIDVLPDDAIAFGVDLMGEARAALYLRTYYATTNAGGENA